MLPLTAQAGPYNEMGFKAIVFSFYFAHNPLSHFLPLFQCAPPSNHELYRLQTFSLVVKFFIPHTSCRFWKQRAFRNKFPKLSAHPFP